jgi:GTP-binding protein Era
MMLLPISALTGLNLELLLDAIVERLPVGPRYYPEDQLTDTFVRDNVAEIIREQVLLLFEDEVPHAVAVKVEEFKERTEQLTYISATIYVERDSQKGIIIGDKGKMLKKVGEASRGQLEQLLETKVYLELWVKVLKNWRKNEHALRSFGYYHRK